MIRLSLFLIVLVSLHINLSAAQADDARCLRVSIIDAPILKETAKSLIQELEKLGQCVDSEILPPKRSEKKRQLEVIDAEFFRASLYARKLGEADYMLPEPARKDFGVLIVPSYSSVKSLKDIKDKHLVGSLGSLWQENILAQSNQNTLVSNFASGLEMVAFGRADAFVAFESSWSEHKDKYKSLVSHRIIDLSGHVVLVSPDEKRKMLFAKAVKNNIINQNY